MTGLTTALLRRACRTFLFRAYPDGAIPPSKRIYIDVSPEQPLESLLTPPVCQVLLTEEGAVRGYTFRLGSSVFPHVKLQAVDCGKAQCIFTVDTHDALHLDPKHPDVEPWTQIQEANRRLKEEVEQAWEAEGLMTFNSLLRDGLAKP